MIAWPTRVSPDIMSLKLLVGRLEIYVAYGSPGSPICAAQFHCIVKLQPAGTILNWISFTVFAFGICDICIVENVMTIFAHDCAYNRSTCVFR